MIDNIQMIDDRFVEKYDRQIDNIDGDYILIDSR